MNVDHCHGEHGHWPSEVIELRQRITRLEHERDEAKRRTDKVRHAWLMDALDHVGETEALQKRIAELEERVPFTLLDQGYIEKLEHENADLRIQLHRLRGFACSDECCRIGG